MDITWIACRVRMSTSTRRYTRTFPVSGASPLHLSPAPRAARHRIGFDLESQRVAHLALLNFRRHAQRHRVTIRLLAQIVERVVETGRVEFLYVIK